MNINNLTMKEVKERWEFRCVHGHNGLAHRVCYETANCIKERVGCLDIETSGLKADYGLLYTYCIKKIDGELIKRTIDVDDWERGNEDKKLVKQFIEDARKFDRFIVHYGTDRKFDIPFLRTRAIIHRLPFPKHKFMCASDTYDILKSKFKLSSNRLGNAGKAFSIPAKEHPLNPKIWRWMTSGNRKLRERALKYILIHNVEDVLTTEKLWLLISPYIQKRNTSI